MCKKLFKKMKKKIGRMNPWDMALVKIAVAGFALLVAKLWSPVLSLEWYWYGLIFIVPYAILFKRLELMDLFQ
jgi:hypothetical protein